MVKTEGVRYDQSNWTRVGGRRKLWGLRFICGERQPKQARMDTKDTQVRVSGIRVPGRLSKASGFLGPSTHDSPQP